MLAVGLLCGLHPLFGQSFGAPSIVLCLFVLVMLSPGHNLIGRQGASLVLSIAGHWAPVVLVLVLLGWATGYYRLFNPTMLVTWGVCTPVLLAVVYRAMTAVMLRRLQQPQFHRRAVVVGSGPVCLRVVAMIRSRHAYGWRVLGVFDDRSRGRARLPPDIAFHGAVDKAPKFIQAQGVSDVFIALPLSSRPRIVQMLKLLENTTASVHFVPDVFGASVVQGRFEDMDGLPVVGLMHSPFTGVNGLVKRTSDIVIASLILLLISPVMLLIALAVWLTSPGPVIFRQDRNGLDGQVIRIYKFRSMTVQENGTDVRQASPDDERFTPVGRWLRRYSLDELPQFVNVLQGRMSVVGPRPHAVAHNEDYRYRVQAYMARHKVRPGITGWAQIHGFRGQTETLEKMEQRVALDLEYLRNWSLRLDLMIILRTARDMLLARNAY